LNTELTSAVAQFSLAAAIVVAAGIFLARFADQIAEITGLGRLLIGSILLAGATSLPELAVDLSAVHMGMPDLAVGDLLGSSLMNLLILAVLDLSYRSRTGMLSRAAAGHALSGTMSMAMTALAGLAILTAAHVPGWSILGISPAAWLIVIAYGFGVRMIFLDQRLSAALAAEARTGAQAQGELSPSEAMKQRPLWKPALGFAIAAAVLVVTGPWLASSAGRIAEQSGLGKSFVGTTFVAFSTSLPELVASLAAVRMGAADLAIGNVFGSNAFNMMLLAPLDAMQAGPLFAAVQPVHIVSCLGAILVTAVAVMGQLYQVESRRRLMEPDALLMLLLIAGSLFFVHQLSPH
jgi:cation:H+ antiporter